MRRTGLIVWAVAVAFTAVEGTWAAAPDTADLQKRIDAVAAKGGGEVCVAAGDYTVGTVFLRSDVTLVLETGATLHASADKTDFADGQRIAVLCAEGARNVAVRGAGTVDGNGGAYQPKNGFVPEGRPRCAAFFDCTNVVIEGVTLRDPAFWTCYFRHCDGVTVRGVTIRSHANYNNDGLDIESRNVLIEDCDIDADDDGICLKSDTPGYCVENVEIRNCHLSSSCNAVKCGTASAGGFRNVRVHDCVIDQRTDSYMWDWRRRVAGVTVTKSGLAAFAFEVVDGGFLEDIRVSNVRVSGMHAPFFVRYGARQRPSDPDRSYLRNVVFTDIDATGVSREASSVTGVPGLRPQNIVFRNCTLRLPGGGSADEASSRVPEAATGYPDIYMFGERFGLPASAFYVRHADGVAFENVVVVLSAADARPALVADDATRISGRPEPVGRPAYPWRGLHLDCGRHFFTKDEVIAFVDRLAADGFNVFHWHLTDHEGWRFPSDRWPLLKTKGATRRVRSPETPNWLEPAGAVPRTPYGPYCYTKDEIREVVRHAGNLGVRVIPEIEQPSHCYAAISAYPFLSCTPKIKDPPKGIGDDAFCASDPRTLRFLTDIIDEVCELFPDDVVHLGGDECNGRNWKLCPDCSAKMRELGFTEPIQLQAWLARQLADHLGKKGRRMAGWDETFRGGIDMPKGTLCTSYLGSKGANAIAERGYDVVMCPSNYCYFDYPQGLSEDPLRYFSHGVPLTTRQVSEFDPLKWIDRRNHGRILGGEGMNWTELTPTADILFRKCWPRAAVLGEVLKKGRDD